MQKHAEDDEDVYVVSVDSRGRSSSDLEAYKDYTCPRTFFNKHLVDEPKAICVTSEMAELCGMKLKIYFFETDQKLENHETADDEHHNRINMAGTLLTFNPETGHTRFKIHGQAYVIWDDGTKPLSKRQIWGIHELIKEAKELYHSVKTHDPTDYTHLRRAKLEIMGWCAQYEAGTWSPHSIYEPRHAHHHHHAHHHSQEEKRSNLKELERCLSGVSDQATYHHPQEYEGHTARTPHHKNLTHKSTSNHDASPIRQDFEHRGPFQEDHPRGGKTKNPFQAIFSACGPVY